MTRRIREVSNSDKVIDIRDARAYLAACETELAADRAELCGDCDGTGKVPVDTVDGVAEPGEETEEDCPTCDGTGEVEGDGDEDLTAQVKALREFVEQFDGYGEVAIHDDYFEDYARELHEDINGRGATGWPYDCIDWERAADALKQDYSLVDFDGQDYWVR